jgi:hypothetical protein
MNGQSNGQGMAVASLVMGILAWLGHCCCCCVGPLLAILAIMFGYSARSAMRGSNSSGWGLATAGIVLGWLYFLLALIWFLIWFVLCFALPCAAVVAPVTCLL